jgi:hypothetical protein
VGWFKKKWLILYINHYVGVIIKKKKKKSFLEIVWLFHISFFVILGFKMLHEATMLEFFNT